LVQARTKEEHRRGAFANQRRCVHPGSQREIRQSAEALWLSNRSRSFSQSGRWHGCCFNAHIVNRNQGSSMSVFGKRSLRFIDTRGVGCNCMERASQAMRDSGRAGGMPGAAAMNFSTVQNGAHDD
jgi:hypothetical protein